MNAFWAALTTLTLFPMSSFRPDARALRHSPAFYPLVGALLGGLLTAVQQLPLAPALRALGLLVLWVFLTAAFHLDGLSDCLDGFFGGAAPAERRRIMKDPSVGAYGVTGIVLLLLSKYVLLASLAGHAAAWKWLLLIPLASRWAATLSCSLFRPPAGTQGLGASVMGLPAPWTAAATLLSLAAGIGLLKLGALEAFLLAGLVSVGVGFLSQSRIGGVTGDGLGATIELSETALLFLAVLSLPHGILPF